MRPGCLFCHLTILSLLFLRIDSMWRWAVFQTLCFLKEETCSMLTWAGKIFCPSSGFHNWDKWKTTLKYFCISLQKRWLKQRYEITLWRKNSTSRQSFKCRDKYFTVIASFWLVFCTSSTELVIGFPASPTKWLEKSFWHLLTVYATARQSILHNYLQRSITVFSHNLQIIRNIDKERVLKQASF